MDAELFGGPAPFRARNIPALSHKSSRHRTAAPRAPQGRGAGALAGDNGRVSPRIRPLPLAALALALGCASSDPAPPPAPTPPLFEDAFDGPAAFPAGWDSVTGDIVAIDAPDARSGGKVVRAQSLTTAPRDALARKSLRPTAAEVQGVTCTFQVKLVRLAGTSPLTVGRVDVGGGALLFDLEPQGWRVFGRFGTQEISERGARPVLGVWGKVSLTIEGTGKIVVRYEDEERIKHVDASAAPLDPRRAAIEIGLASPALDGNTEAHFDDVVCATK